jgi:hypothetical protein
MTTQRKHEMKKGGMCICPKCGEKIAHRRSVPCQEERCPGCGGKMLREGSPHHQLLLKVKSTKDEVEQLIDSATN